MKRYYAAKEGTGIYLSRTEQIERYREAGWDIYEVDSGENVRCVPRESVTNIEIESKKTGGIKIGDREIKTSNR